VVDGLVDRLIQRFLTKHVVGRQQASKTCPPPEDRPRLEFPRMTSLPVFPAPPLFSPLPFPVGGGDMLAMRRAYAERCAYVDALVQRARNKCATNQDDVTMNYDNSTSGQLSSTAVTVTGDHCSMVPIISPRRLLSYQQLLQPPAQVPNIL